MIKTEDIKRLLDRYYDGTTTEEEEEALRTYFNGSDIDASLREESVFFTALHVFRTPYTSRDGGTSQPSDKPVEQHRSCHSTHD